MTQITQIISRQRLVVNCREMDLRHLRHLRRLMAAMHDWCRSEGIERVVLNASTFGQPVYAGMGYVVATEPMMRLKL